MAHGHSFSRRGTMSRRVVQRIPRSNVEESSTAPSAIPAIASTIHL